jgi:hypothetical protein
MVFLHNLGVRTARAVRIFKTYGADAVQIMSDNPYRSAVQGALIKRFLPTQSDECWFHLIGATYKVTCATCEIFLQMLHQFQDES